MYILAPIRMASWAIGHRRMPQRCILLVALCLLAIMASADVRVVQVATGYQHTCALDADGRVKCWGDNSSGQLGDGTFVGRTTPVDVIGLSLPVTAVAAGGLHTCALSSSGGVKCWGFNRFGQLGDGSYDPRGYSPPDANVPVDVVGIPASVVAIAAGATHTCALSSSAYMYCWGANDWGQLGDATRIDRGKPAPVHSSNLAAIAVGGSTSAALTGDGRVKYWGTDGFTLDCPPGPVCFSAPAYFSSPTDASFLPAGVTAISLSLRQRGYLCALAPGGRVMCWGGVFEEPGHLITNDAALNALPEGVTAISMGGGHNCVLLPGGIAHCWGNNDHGQLGFALPPGLAAISAGLSHTCALTMLGELLCWGANEYGQVGDGTRVDRTMPARVLMSTTPNYQGLWWNTPAGSEAGWGINFAHQRDTIFATWFTYGAAGKPLWLAVVADKVAPDVYSGDLFVANGPPFDAVPFDPATVVEKTVGNATFTFTDGNRVLFAYTVDAGPPATVSSTRSKTLERMQFGPLPTCAWDVQTDLAVASNYQDLWWAAPPGSESGWGISLAHQDDIIFGTWFTHDAGGEPLWLIVVASKKGAGVYKGPISTVMGPPLNAEPFDPAKVVETVVGDATLTFLDGNRANFSYTVLVDGKQTQQTKAITRLVFDPPGTLCQ